jgi:hypothetical protein
MFSLLPLLDLGKGIKGSPFFIVFVVAREGATRFFSYLKKIQIRYFCCQKYPRDLVVLS